MRKLFAASLGLVLLAPAVRAFTYQVEDLLLVFRKNGADDFLFNLGKVGAFLDVPSGQEITVTGWDLAAVQSAYALDADVRVALVASTKVDSAERRAWLTSAELSGTPLDRTPSQWQGLWSKISSFGLKAQEYTQLSATNAFRATPSLIASYTYIASNGGSQPSAIGTLGGTSVFPIDAAVPATLKFVEVRPSTANPKPAARVLGTFTLGTDGVLKYRAGGEEPLLPVTIASIRRGANGVTVSFPSVVGTNYRLRYSDALGAAPASWTTGSATASGTGGELLLVDAEPLPADRFYSVETYR